MAACAYGFVCAWPASLTVLAAALRDAEHQIGGTTLDRRAAALRNLRCNAATRLMRGAYGFGSTPRTIIVRACPTITRPSHAVPPDTALPARTRNDCAARKGAARRAIPES